MFSGQQKPDPQDMSHAERHQDVAQMLDEIKRYVAGIYSKVDTEIDDIRSMVNNIEKLMRENDRQIDRIEQFDRNIRNIEATVKDIQRKIK